MKLSIYSETRCSPEELRTLLIDAAEQLTGKGSRVLETRLPWDGHPILLVDAELHPVVVSFDAEQNQTALLNGLMAVEKLSSALAWVNQVYEVLQQREQPPRLVVVSPEYPPGATAILASCKRLRLFQFKTLRINGETGLWLEQLEDDQRPPHASTEVRAAPAVVPRVETPSAPVRQPERAAADQLPALSKEEITYFQQL